MTKQEEQDFIRLIKEGTLDALRSENGQDAIAEALKTKKSQGAIIDAMFSPDGQEAIKNGTLSALKSAEGEDVIMNYLVDYFHDVIEPSLEDISHDIKTLKTEVKYMKDNHNMRIERLERKARVVS